MVERGGRRGVAWCGGLYRAGSSPPSRYGSRESSAVSGVSAFGTGAWRAALGLSSLWCEHIR